MSRPPFERFERATCKGSYALGSACGHCEKCAWECAQMTGPRLAPSPFEQFAAERQLDIAPAVFPDSTRVYADMRTQTAFECWNGGAAHLARALTESTFETEALRERIRKLASREEA